MKIIGTRSKGYIVDVSEDELANIMGYRDRYKFNGAYPRVGDDVKIEPVYKKFDQMRRNQKQLINLSKSLHTIAELVEPFEMQVEEALEADLS